MIYPSTTLKKRYYVISEGRVIAINSTPHCGNEKTILYDEDGNVDIEKNADMFPHITLNVNEGSADANGTKDLKKIYLWLDGYINVGDKFTTDKGFSQGLMSDHVTFKNYTDIFKDDVNAYVSERINQGYSLDSIKSSLPVYLVDDTSFHYSYNGKQYLIDSVEGVSAITATEDELIEQAANDAGVKAANDVLTRNGSTKTATKVTIQ